MISNYPPHLLNRKRLPWLLCPWIALVALGTPGCGPSVGQPTGKVTLKGLPIAGAELEFASEMDAKSTFHGISVEDGAYHLSYREGRGLPVGRYKVTIDHYTLPNGKPLPPGEAGEALKSKERARKNSYVFMQDIASGANAVDFELTKGKK